MRRSTALLVAGLALAAPARAATERPPILRQVGFDQRLGVRVPLDAEFRDETGRVVTLGSLVHDKPVLLVPAYYRCPMLCTLVLGGVVSALRALPFDVGREFRVVTFSFDPREGSDLAAAKKASLLAEYRRPGAAEGWHALTGDDVAIRRLTEAIGFRYAFDTASEQYAHASGIVVLTPEGTISHYFYGVEFPPRDLRLALVEAADARIGSPIDQLLLFCFHYDPATGRYGKVALGAVRAAGVLTLLALAVGVGLALRREAGRRSA